MKNFLNENVVVQCGQYSTIRLRSDVEFSCAEPNVDDLSSLFEFALGSAHEKFDV